MEAVKEKKKIKRYPKYKDSGVEWIGEVPEGWEVRRVKNVADMIVSNVDKHKKPLEHAVKLCNYVDVYKNKFITEEIDFMDATASPEEIKAFILKTDDVLITKDSEDWQDIGVPALVKYTSNNLLCGYHLAILRSRNNFTGSFLYYSFASTFIRSQLSVKANGVTRYGLSHGAIEGTIILTPSVAEQSAIADFLDRKTALIDRAIGIKEKQIELLKERRQILIHKAVTRGLNDKAKMKDSGVEWIGEIPEGWEVKRVKYLFGQSKEIADRKDEIVTAFRDGEVTLRKNRRTQGFTIAVIEQGYQKIKKGQLVLNSMDAFEGAIGVSDSNGKCTPEYVICDPLSQDLDSFYFAYLLREMALAKYIQVICHAVRERAIRIRFTELGQLFLPVPTYKEQKEITSFVEKTKDSINSVITVMEKEIEKLQEYKSTLINSVVTGKIKVC